MKLKSKSHPCLVHSSNGLRAFCFCWKKFFQGIFSPDQNLRNHCGFRSSSHKTQKQISRFALPNPLLSCCVTQIGKNRFFFRQFQISSASCVNGNSQPTRAKGPIWKTPHFAENDDSVIQSQNQKTTLFPEKDITRLVQLTQKSQDILQYASRRLKIRSKLMRNPKTQTWYTRR